MNNGIENRVVTTTKFSTAARLGPDAWEMHRMFPRRSDTTDELPGPDSSTGLKMPSRVVPTLSVSNGMELNLPEHRTWGRKSPKGVEINKGSDGSSKITTLSPLTEVSMHLLNDINTDKDGNLVDESGRLLSDIEVRAKFSIPATAEIEPIAGSPKIGEAAS